MGLSPWKGVLWVAAVIDIEGWEKSGPIQPPWVLPRHPAGGMSQQVPSEDCLNEGVIAVSQAWSPGGPGSGCLLSGHLTRKL